MARARAGSVALLALLLICVAFSEPASAAGAGDDAKGGSRRAKAPPCRDLATRGECAASGGGSRCRWCSSEQLDDMCFGAAEAWRLPRQVFTCDPPAGAAHARK